MLHSDTLSAKGRPNDTIKRRLRDMATAVAEPNGFWKSLALGLAGLVVCMLGWFLIDQAYQSRQFRQETRAWQVAMERRLGRIEQQIGE